VANSIYRVIPNATSVGEFDVAQTLHGFIKGRAIYHNGTQWAAADSTDPTFVKTARAIVKKVVDANNFTATEVKGGKIAFTSAETLALTGVSAFTIGQWYHYNNLGNLTLTEPFLVSHPVAQAISTTTLAVDIMRPVNRIPVAYESGETVLAANTTISNGSIGTLLTTPVLSRGRWRLTATMNVSLATVTNVVTAGIFDAATPATPITNASCRIVTAVAGAAASGTWSIEVDSDGTKSYLLRSASNGNSATAWGAADATGPIVGSITKLTYTKVAGFVPVDIVPKTYATMTLALADTTVLPAGTLVVVTDILNGVSPGAGWTPGPWREEWLLSTSGTFSTATKARAYFQPVSYYANLTAATALNVAAGSASAVADVAGAIGTVPDIYGGASWAASLQASCSVNSYVGGAGNFGGLNLTMLDGNNNGIGGFSTSGGTHVLWVDTDGSSVTKRAGASVQGNNHVTVFGFSALSRTLKFRASLSRAGSTANAWSGTVGDTVGYGGITADRGFFRIERKQ
jgi:hypothetical protein